MKFHLSIINSKRSETFNAKPAIEKFKDVSIGVLRVSEIHISSRSEIETYEGARLSRKQFDESKGEGYYACDGKVVLFDDVL